MILGILGGTFDPIHLGHLHLANTVHKKANLQYIKIIPCYRSPLRQQPFADAKDRVEMIKLAIVDFPHLKLDEREINNPQPSYAVDTIESIRLEVGLQTSLCFIMGDDAFAEFTKWHEWKKILELSHLIVTTRKSSLDSDLYSPEILALLHQHQTFHTNDLSTQPFGCIWLVDINPLKISSTEIRSLIKKNQSVKKFLPEKVFQYIEKQNLYRR
jgi:nicotinate-nucleotide adenylyltransferase